jgi:hypothetical protein
MMGRAQDTFGNGAWSIMDGTGFAQVIQAEWSGGDSPAPVQGSSYEVRGTVHFKGAQVFIVAVQTLAVGVGQQG